jgi:hypothetical protein
MSDIDPSEFLAALDDAREDRASMYPGGRVVRSIDDDDVVVGDRRRRLSPSTCELGLRRVAEIRAQLEQRRAARDRGRSW